MFNINNIYELYIKFSLKKIDKVKEKNKTYSNNINILKKKIDAYEKHIEKYCRINLLSIYSFTNLNHIKKIHFPMYSIFDDNGNVINFKALKLYITKYIEYNKAFKRNEELIVKYNKEIITKKLYVLIISKFNKKVIHKIIHNNLNFSLNNYFGYIGVYKVMDNRKKIDWGKSTKNKNKLIEQGKIPYLKKDAKNNPNYKGVPWIEYREPLNFLIIWSKTKKIRKLLPIISDYSFIPARGGSSFVSKLAEFKRDKEKALLTYTRQYKHGTV